MWTIAAGVVALYVGALVICPNWHFICVSIVTEEPRGEGDDAIIAKEFVCRWPWDIPCRSARTKAGRR